MESDRYQGFAHRLRTAVVGSPGTTDAALRAAVEARAAALGGRPGQAGGGLEAPGTVTEAGGAVPEALRVFVDKVARRAFEVTDQDVDALRHAGYSEDAIFEITASAAVGAGIARLDRGLAALRGEV
jgi:alkylhydroperoxidase family enzyme